MFRVKREAHPIGAVEVPEQALADQRQEGDDEPEHPNTEQDADRPPSARGEVVEGVDDADVLLQGEVGEEEDRHLGGEHGQGADHLTLDAVHPGLGVTVVLATELEVVGADHEQVNTHQPIRTCAGGDKYWHADLVWFGLVL